MTDPAGDLSRVINTAMSVAVSGFFIMNIALFMVIPFQTMRERSAVVVVSNQVKSRTPLEV